MTAVMRELKEETGISSAEIVYQVTSLLHLHATLNLLGPSSRGWLSSLYLFCRQLRLNGWLVLEPPTVEAAKISITGGWRLQGWIRTAPYHVFCDMTCWFVQCRLTRGWTTTFQLMSGCSRQAPSSSSEAKRRSGESSVAHHKTVFHSLFKGSLSTICNYGRI